MDSTAEAHRLRYPKYVRRLKKFNEANAEELKKMSEKMYENARMWLYHIEVNGKGLKDIRWYYKNRTWWTKKETEQMILFIRNAFPDDWFIKRARKNWNAAQKKQEEKPKFQYDIDFNQVPTR